MFVLIRASFLLSKFMAKITKRFQNNFTQISNEFIRILPMKELAMYVYLLSLPDEWNLSIEGVCATTSWGETQVRTALNSLERIGLLKRIKHKDEKGRWDWDYILDNKIGQIPYMENLHVEKPSVENPHMENPRMEYPTVVNPTVENPQIYKERIIKKQDKYKNNKETVSTEDDTLDFNCDLVIGEWNKVNSTSLKSKREFRENLRFWLSEGYTIEEILYAIRRKVLVPDKFLKDISIVTFFRKSNSQGPCNYIEQVLNYKLGEADGTKQRPDEHALEMREFGETRYTIADLGSDRIDYLNGKGFELEKATGFIKRKEDGYTKSYIVYADGTLKDLID
jgi:predicted transcriptional regulator